MRPVPSSPGTLPAQAAASPQPVDLADQSVAGEEDPGACDDLAAAQGRRDMAPGDQASTGTEGTGEGICPRCGGSGRLEGNQPCPDCEGRGRVVQGIGGA